MKKILCMMICVMLLFGSINSVYAEDKRVTTISLKESEVASHDLVVTNLLPGDDINERVLLNVNHNNDSKISLRFVPEENAFMPLIDAFTVRVYIEEMAKEVYNGKIKDLTGEDLFVKHVNNKEKLHYTFDLHFSEEAGNECENKALKGQFIWTCESVGELPDKDVYTPDTGDNSSIIMYSIVLMLAAACIIALVLYRRRKGE